MAHVPDCDGIDLRWMQDSDTEEEDDFHSTAPVKYMSHDLSIRSRLRGILVRSTVSRLVGTIFDLVVKLLLCIIFCVRVGLDDFKSYACNGELHCNSTYLSIVDKSDGMEFSSTGINWYVLLWVHRPLPLWIIQVFLAFVTFSKALLLIYVATKGNRLELLFHSAFILEFICSIPFIITVFYPPLLMHLFIPSFLNCWLAKQALEKLFNDLHLTRQKFQTISVTLSQQLLIVTTTLTCVIFTTICGIQHIQRGSPENPLTMFESIYFVIVTFSTVGYGDISPDIWLGQLFIMIMICVAFALIPRQIETIASTFLERQKAGGEYSRRKAASNRHVVVVSSEMSGEGLMDFLTEFYAHPKLEDMMVIMLSSDELRSSMQAILRDPKWTHRVIYMRGSALKDIDLKRCRINQAEACFVLAPRKCTDKNQADHHTILRSWAVKDFAPKCKQYIQLFNAENKLHVKFAEHVVCEDEFKYALLANNCLYPGLSTLVTLLMHTSKGLENEEAEQWQQLYGRHSGNEIYHIQLAKSAFFSRYENKKFTDASYDAHQRFGVGLMAVLDTTKPEPRLQLNPGPEYIMKGSDYCFYLSVTKEEYTKIDPAALRDDPKSMRARNMENMALELQKMLLISEEEEEEDQEEESVFNTITSQMGIDLARKLQAATKPSTEKDKEPDVLLDRIGDGADVTDGLEQNADGKVLQMYSDMGQEEFITGSPPVTLYVGTKRTVCHLLKDRRPYCCLEWGKNCDHCKYKNANDERWRNQLIILAAEHATNGIYNFIVPLRSEFISMKSLSPIILLVEEMPDKVFLETISAFPMVYWMKGTITSVDDLLRAGINKASHLVVVNRESPGSEKEEILTDSDTIVAVQTIFKLFPKANIITELSQSSNMRFMHFRAHDENSQQISRLEKKLQERATSSLSHMFRLPFAAGQVFSASMLDTLLYQTFVKGYLITFVRLLLGIDAEENSGHLSSIRVKRTTLARYRTYGQLYQGLCNTTGEIPIALYRTESPRVPDADRGDVTENNNKSKETKPQKKPSFNIKQEWNNENTEQADISDLIRNRMKSLDLLQDDYTESEPGKNAISYVLLNPSPKRKLKTGDIIYVIQPSAMFAVPSRLKWRNFKYRTSWSPRLGRHAPIPESRSRSQSMSSAETHQQQNVTV